MKHNSVSQNTLTLQKKKLHFTKYDLSKNDKKNPAFCKTLHFIKHNGVSQNTIILQEKETFHKKTKHLKKTTFHKNTFQKTTTVHKIKQHLPKRYIFEMLCFDPPRPLYSGSITQCRTYSRPKLHVCASSSTH